MRILYFGMNGAFSYLPLAAVLQSISKGQQAGLEVTAVFLPASAVPSKKPSEPFIELPPERPNSDLPLIQPYLSENIIHLAWANDIPVFLLRNMRDAAVHTLIHDLQPDVACVACFPFIVPEEVLTLSKYGFLNIHPSLLPAYRGPDPLFWIFRNGDQANTGVTLHWMDEGMDSGDILSQRPISLPDGISGTEADRLCATLGSDMLLAGLEQIKEGNAPRRRQPPGGSYQAHPTTEAFTLDIAWSARRAFNFMRGTAEWSHPYRLTIGSQTLSLRTADSYKPNQTLLQPIQEKGGHYLIQFSPGTLLAYGSI